jgi:glucose-fructose oxidoreductase
VPILAVMADRTIGFAVVGLGHIAQTAVLPAFAHAEHARPVALVSGDRKKREELGRAYGLRALYGYDEYDACLASAAVDAVYIALPNSMHRDYAVRAARAGVHVLCEKPMALDEDECRSMIAAADENDVRLMIAYRLHFDPANLEAIRLVQEGAIGEPRVFSSTFGYQVRAENIRTSSALGGGPIWDLGVYCVNAARYLFRAEPEEVSCFTGKVPGDGRFREVEAGASALLRFPGDRFASFTVHYGTSAVSEYRLLGSRGELRLDPAYEYQGELRLSWTADGKSAERVFAPHDQFAPELDAFAEGVLEGRQPEPGGAEGLADVRVIRALFRSAASGRAERLPSIPPRAYPRPEQAVARPPIGEPPATHVEAPHAG